MFCKHCKKWIGHHKKCHEVIIDRILTANKGKSIKMPLSIFHDLMNHERQEPAVMIDYQHDTIKFNGMDVIIDDSLDDVVISQDIAPKANLGVFKLLNI